MGPMTAMCPGMRFEGQNAGVFKQDDALLGCLASQIAVGHGDVGVEADIVKRAGALRIKHAELHPGGIEAFCGLGNQVFLDQTLTDGVG